MINKLIRFLENKWVTWLIVFICIAGRALQLNFFYSIRFDGSYQVIAAQNFLQGHGITISRAFSNDISNTIYEPLINWPPGYSVLFALFYSLTGENYIAAGVIIDVLAAIVLILSCRGILKIFSLPVYQINLFSLFTSFFIYYFYFISSTDAIAISFFVAALHLALRLLSNKGSLLQNSSIMTLLLFAVASIKYLFIPVVFLVPIAIFLKGLADQNSQWKKTGVISFTILLLAIGGLLAWQQYQAGSPVYISESGRGFFPSHLLSANPFLPASILKPDTAGSVLGLSVETGTALYRVWQFFHVIAFITIIYAAIRTVRVRGFKNLLLQQYFFLLSVAIMLVITALLAVLSLTVTKEEILPGWFWTYVEEARYYGLVTVLLHLNLFVFYDYFRNTGRKLVTSAFLVSILMLLPELLRGIVFDAKRLALYATEEYQWQRELRFQEYANEVLEIQKSIFLTRTVMVSGSSYYMNNRVAVYSKVPVFNEIDKLNQVDSIRSTKPALMVVIIDEKDFPTFKPFITGRQPVGRFEDYVFYTIYVSTP